MKDMLANFKENPLKLALFVGGPVLLLLVIVVVVVVLTVGDSSDAEEVEFVFDDTLAEPVMAVEDQVALTVAAMIPTETPVPTPNVPLTLEAEAREKIALTPTIQMVPTPDPFASTLSAADIRYLDSFGHPVWLATRAYMELIIIFEEIPDDVLVVANSPRIDRIRTEAQRAGTRLDESTYLRRDVSGPVRSYGTYVEETIHKLIDAANQASAMFALVDLPDVTYEDLSRPERAQVNEYYHEVGDLLQQFAISMERYGCSACGEVYRGR